MDIVCATCGEEFTLTHNCTKADCPHFSEHHAFIPRVQIGSQRLRPEVVDWVVNTMLKQSSWPSGEFDTITKLSAEMLKAANEARGIETDFGQQIISKGGV